MLMKGMNANEMVCFNKTDFLYEAVRIVFQLSLC